MTETTLTVAPEDETEAPSKLKKFKKYAIISAAAVAAVLVGGYILSHTSSDEEEDETEETTETVTFTDSTPTE